MAQNPPAKMPRITPHLHCDDVSLALNGLEKVFRLERRGEIRAPDGMILHAKMQFAEGL